MITRQHPALRRGAPALAAALATATGLAVLAACAPAENAQTSRSNDEAQQCPIAPKTDVSGQIRLAYQEIPNGDLVVKDSGVLEACLPNASIEWSKFNSGGDVIQAFGSKSVDLGLVGSAPATKALSAPLNIDAKVVWVQDVIGAAESLAVRDTNVSDIKQLEGKKIAVPFASTAHYSLLAALDRAGLSDKVDLVDLQPDAIRAAWQSGEIDAAWVWQPTLGELLGDGKGKILVTGEDTAKQGAPTYDLSAATSEFVEKNPAALEAWTAAQNWAVGLLQNEPEEANKRIAAELGVSLDQVAEQTKGYTYLDAKTQAGEKYLGGGLGTDIEKTADFLHGQGEIDSVGSPEHYRDALYVDAAKKVAQ